MVRRSLRRRLGGPCSGLWCQMSLAGGEPTEVERRVEGPGMFAYAHEACYKSWREESVARRPGTAELGPKRPRRGSL